MLTDLIARAWEQERAKYEVNTGIGIAVRLTAWGPDEIVPDTEAERQAHLDRLCAAAVERAIADAGYVVAPAEPNSEMHDAYAGWLDKMDDRTDDENVYVLWGAWLIAAR